MKKLLLTSAIVAVAGAAAAEVTWSGSAEFGYKSHTEVGTNWVETTDSIGNGLYVKAGLDATASAELNDGVTASITYGLGLDYGVEDADGDAGSAKTTLNNYPTIKLESSVATLTVGDVEHAAYSLFKGTDGMAVGFTERETGHKNELVARVDTTLSGATIGLDYTIIGKDDDLAATNMNLEDANLNTGAITLGAQYEFSGIALSAAYETNPMDAPADDSNIWGISAGYTWNGINATLAYTSATSLTEEFVVSSKIADPKTTIIFDEASSIGLGLGYEMSNGLKLNAGIGFNSGTIGAFDASFISYEIGASFKAMGADVTVSYEDIAEFDTTAAGAPIDPEATIKVDASYTLESYGATVLAGYNSSKANLIGDDVTEYGAFYAGATYDMGGGAKLFAAYSQFDEAGAEEFVPGTSLGVKLSF